VPSQTSRWTLALLICGLGIACGQPGTSNGPGATDAGPADSGPNPSGDAGPTDSGPNPTGDAGPMDAGPNPSGDAGPMDAGPSDAGSADAGPCHAPYQWIDGYCSGPCNSEVLCKCANGMSEGVACPQDVAMACAAVCAPYGGYCPSGTCASDAGPGDAGPSGDAGPWPAAGCETSGGICLSSGTCATAGGTVVALGGCTFSDGAAECCVPPRPAENPTTCATEGGLCAPIGGCLEAGGWLSYSPDGGGELCPFNGNFACCVPHTQCGNATADCCAWPTIYTQACFDGVLSCPFGSPVPIGTCGPNSGSGDAGPGPTDAGPTDAGAAVCGGTTSGSCPGTETCCECCGAPGACSHSCLSVGSAGCPLCE